MSLIEPPLRIYVDEAGTPDFRLREEGQDQRAYVTCGVAIPALTSDRIREVLPRRASDGKLLKSSELEVTEDQVLEFFHESLAEPIDVGLILIDPGGPESADIIARCTEASNAMRGERHDRRISPSTLAYMFLAVDAVAAATAAAGIRTGVRPSYVDIVFDEASISPRHKSEFDRVLRKAASNNGIEIREVVWGAEQEIPELLAPDHFAGVFHRSATAGDLMKAAQFLFAQQEAGRLFIQDGKKINVPGPPPTPPEEASDA